MAEDKKAKLEDQDKQVKEENELTDDDLFFVSGGTMKDSVYVSKTTDISDSTRDRV